MIAAVALLAILFVVIAINYLADAFDVDPNEKRATEEGTLPLRIKRTPMGEYRSAKKYGCEKEDNPLKKFFI